MHDILQQLEAKRELARQGGGAKAQPGRQVEMAAHGIFS
jgi:hypothetical protein